MMLGRGTRWWEKKEEEVDGEEEGKEQRNNEGEVGMGKREEEEKGNLVSVQSVSCCSLLTPQSSRTLRPSRSLLQTVILLSVAKLPH